MSGTGNIGTLSLIARMSQLEREKFVGNPQITFFKSVYRRHTNFSRFLSSETYQDNGGNAFGNPVSYTLSTTIGDLLSKVYLQHKIKEMSIDDSGNARTIYANLGTNLIKNDDDSLSITIGTNTIFQNNGLYLEAKQELLNDMCVSASGNYSVSPNLSEVAASNITTDTGSNASLITCNNGSHNNYTTFSGGVSGVELPAVAKSYETEYFYLIPDFSFGYDYGLALPLCCMRSEEVTLNIDYNSPDKVMDISNPHLESTCITEYIHLDVEEKKRFIMNDHNYIIETVKQKDCAASENSTVLSGFTGLTKYILMVGNGNSDPTLSTSVSQSTPTKIEGDDITMNLTIDGNNLNAGNYNKNIFTRLNLYEYFPGCGRELFDGGTPDKNYGHLDSIGVFPIALEPLNMTQPSGCISNKGSGIGSLILDLGTNTNKLKIYTVDYNILIISNGTCQKALY